MSDSAPRLWSLLGLLREAFWPLLGPFLEVLGPLGPPMGLLGAPMGLPWGAHGAPRGRFRWFQNGLKNSMGSFGAIFVLLGSILVPFGVDFGALGVDLEDVLAPPNRRKIAQAL